MEGIVQDIRTTDFIVVGGGSSGAVVASRLSEEKRFHVALLEAGGWDSSPFIRIPAGSIKAIMNPEYNWFYQAEPDASRNDRADMWPAGKVLGGGSSINGMMYVRGNRGDYDQWAQLGCKGWSYDDVLPFFNKAETNENGGSRFRGGKGPLRVSNARLSTTLADAFIASGVRAGIPHNPDTNGAEQEGIGPCQATQNKGWRHSTARAYLAKAKRRSNLKVETRFMVSRVLIENGRAIGVEGVQNGRTVRYLANKEVILCGGALSSPKILMLSGIGPAKHLGEHGIPVVVDSPGVGQNLQEHPGVLMSTHVGIDSLNVEVQSVARIVKHGLNFALFGRGPATACVASALAFIRTRDHLEWPNIQLSFSPIAYDFTPDGVHLYKRAAIGVAINICRPETRGQLLLRSTDPSERPIIQHELLGGDDEIKQLIEGCRIVRKIFRSKPFSEYDEGERLPGKQVETDADWIEYIRQSAFLMYHPTGTCAMGIGPSAVLDPELRVKGVTGLRVADASIMPTLVSANTNAPCIMIGERAADLIRKSH
jgi:choline dehydrogenase